MKNSFYDILSKYEWKQYHSKMNKILNSTYGDFTRLDIINGKLIETVFENGKEQVKNIYKPTLESNYITEFIVEEVNKNGHYNSGEIQNFIEEMLGEGNFTRYNSTDNTNNQFTKQEQNSRNTNENNRYSARTTIEENYSTVNRGKLDNSSFSLRKKLAEGTYKTAGVQINDEIIAQTREGKFNATNLQKRYTNFLKKYSSDFDTNSKKGTNSGYYIIDNNLVKLTTTKENNKY